MRQQPDAEGDPSRIKAAYRHALHNRLAGLILYLRLFGAELRANASDAEAVRSLVREHYVRLDSILSGLLADLEAKGSRS